MHTLCRDLAVVCAYGRDHKLSAINDAAQPVMAHVEALRELLRDGGPALLAERRLTLLEAAVVSLCRAAEHWTVGVDTCCLTCPVRPDAVPGARPGRLLDRKE